MRSGEEDLHFRRRGEDVGSVFVYQQKGPDSYEIGGRSNSAGAGNFVSGRRN